MESSEEAMEKVQKQHSLNEQLKELHSKLDYTIQARIPQTDLMAMALVLVEDPTIFEILKGLLEYQNTKEKVLKQQRDEQILAHQKDIENYTRTLSDSELAHTVALAKKQHQNAMKEIDRKIVQQLDDEVKDQQRTLCLLKIPGFYETSDNKAIVTQMHLVSLLLRIQKTMETPML